MKTYKVCDALDQTPRAGIEGVVLKTVDNLVDEDTHDLIVSALRGTLDVVQREMYFLVGLGAKSVSHTVHRAKDEQNLLHSGRYCLWGIKPVESSEDSLVKCNFGLDSSEKDIGAFMVQVVDAEEELWDWPRIRWWWYRTRRHKRVTPIYENSGNICILKYMARNTLGWYSSCLLDPRVVYGSGN